MLSTTPDLGLMLYRIYRKVYIPVQAAKMVAEGLMQAAGAAELRDDVKAVTIFRQNAERWFALSELARWKAVRETKTGRYWDKGKLSTPDDVVVWGTGIDGDSFVFTWCNSLGCALKHAKFALTFGPIQSVALYDRDDNQLTDWTGLQSVLDQQAQALVG